MPVALQSVSSDFPAAVARVRPTHGAATGRVSETGGDSMSVHAPRPRVGARAAATRTRRRLVRRRRTIPISGTQTVVDENAGTFKMHGKPGRRLGGHDVPRARRHARVSRQGQRALLGVPGRGEPAGTLKFRDGLQGAPRPHPGRRTWSGAHACTPSPAAPAPSKARGVMVMADTPTADGVSTSSIGNLTLAPGRVGRSHSSYRRAQAAAVPRSCGR